MERSEVKPGMSRGAGVVTVAAVGGEGQRQVREVLLLPP